MGVCQCSGNAPLAKNLGERGLLFAPQSLLWEARPEIAVLKIKLLTQICEKLYTPEHNAFLIVQEGDDSIFLSTKRDMSYREMPAVPVCT